MCLSHLSAFVFAAFFSTALVAQEAVYRIGFEGSESGGNGVIVKSVSLGTDATRLHRQNETQRYSLVSGDVVVKVNGIETPNLQSYFQALAKINGGEVILTVRDAQGNVDDWVARSGANSENPPRLKIDASFFVSKQNPDLRGLRVLRVDPNGPASHLRLLNPPNSPGYLESGDIITEIDGEQIESVEHYFGLISTSAASNGGSVAMTVYDVHGHGYFHWAASVGKLKKAPGARQVYALVVGLTNDAKIGKAMEGNIETIRRLIEEQIPAEKIGGIRTIEGNDCTAPNILAAVDSTPCTANDTLLVWYNGHGAYDPTHAAGDYSNGHHFQIPNGALMRKTLMGHMLAKHARMTVLLSESCNVKSVAYATAWQYAAGVPLPRTFEVLLLYHSGLVDINSSSKDQYSFSTMFTGKACTFFAKEDCSSWKVAFKKIARQVNASYKETRAQVLAAPSGIPADTLKAYQEQTDMVPTSFRDLDLAVIDQKAPRRPRAVPSEQGY